MPSLLLGVYLGIESRCTLPLSVLPARVPQWWCLSRPHWQCVAGTLSAHDAQAPWSVVEVRQAPRHCHFCGFSHPWSAMVQPQATSSQEGEHCAMATPEIPATWELRQEDRNFKASLGNLDLDETL